MGYSLGVEGGKGTFFREDVKKHQNFSIIFIDVKPVPTCFRHLFDFNDFCTIFSSVLVLPIMITHWEDASRGRWVAPWLAPNDLKYTVFYI